MPEQHLRQSWSCITGVSSSFLAAAGLKRGLIGRCLLCAGDFLCQLRRGWMTRPLPHFCSWTSSLQPRFGTELGKRGRRLTASMGRMSAWSCLAAWDVEMTVSSDILTLLGFGRMRKRLLSKEAGQRQVTSSQLRWEGRTVSLSRSGSRRSH